MSEARKAGRDLLTFMREKRLTAYGSVVQGDTVRAVLGIVLPPVAEKKVFDRAALLELGAVDYVRNVLLGEGKYFGQKDGDYRVYLPSENEKQVHRYMEHADHKLKRGLKLARNSPANDVTPTGPGCDLEARLMMRRHDVKKYRNL